MGDNVVWLSSYDDLCDHLATVTPGSSIPIIAPTSNFELQVWQDVVAHYESRRNLTTREPGESGSEWIFTVGEDFADGYGHAMAGIFRRKRQHFSTLREVVRPLVGVDAESVIICGRPKNLTSVELLRFLVDLERAGVRGIPSWSIVPVDNIAEASYYAAKLELARIDGDYSYVCVDALNSRLYRAWRRTPITKPGLDAAMATAMDVLTVAGHGDGAHIHLELGQMCGLIGEAEVIEGVRVGDGCALDGCRRSVGEALFHARHMKPILLVMLTCNGYAVAGEHYPSDSSLVRAALLGYATSVIAPIGEASIDSSDPTMLEILLRDGYPLSDIVSILNGIRRTRGEMARYVVCGSSTLRVGPHPNGVLSSPNAVAESVVQTGEGSLARRSVSLIESRHEGAVPALRVGGGGSTARSALIASGEHLVLLRGEPAEGLTVTSQAERLEALRRRLDVLGDSITAARDYQVALVHTPWLGSGARLIQPAIDDLGDTLTALEALWRTTSRGALTSRKRGVWQASLEHLEDDLNGLVGAWDRKAADLFELATESTVFRRLQYFRSDELSADGDACSRCGATTQVVTQTPASAARRLRIRVDCPICGPLKEYRPGGREIGVESLSVGDGAREITVECHLTPGAEPLAGDGHLVVQVLDKGLGGVAGRLRQAQGEPTRRESIRVPLRAEVGSELHEFRVCWIEGLEVATAQRRFVVLPESLR